MSKNSNSKIGSPDKSPQSPRIGVYVCHCGSNIAGKVDVKDVASFAANLPNVIVSKEYVFMCSEPGQKQIQDDIRQHKLNRIVVAACSPSMHEKTFRKVLVSTGLNPYLLQMANIREQCSWVTEDAAAATEKAKAMVAGAVGRTQLLKPLKKSEVPVAQAIMVVGGGIAGVQAALQCADAGYKVYLVEKEQSIGGHMAMLDKTFPTLDCSACILTPKMVSVGQHPNIELLTYSEVESVGGYVGNIKVKVRRKATGVDYVKCNGCGICQEKCPAKADNEFEQNRNKRKAIYTMFPQAVPNKPVIDREACIFYQKGKCRACEKLCPKGAINFEDQDRFEDITVGSVILTTGHKIFDAKKMANFGYGRLPDVYTSLEFERMVNSSGYSHGHIKTSAGEVPKAVGIIHCVGSRDKRHLPHCSQICCMYSLKFAHLIREHTGADVYNFYIDMRCVGKGYEQFYDRMLHEGVHMIRGKVAEVLPQATAAPSEKGRLVATVEDTLAGTIRKIPLDMVILANGIQAADDAGKVARTFGVSRDPDGFFMEQHPKLNPFGTTDQCVFIAGTCAGPKDIPHTVSQASAAAAGAITILKQENLSIESITATVHADRCSGCRICNQVCPYEAIKYNEEMKASCVDEGLCRGCGTCVAACPSGAIEGNHFTSEQIMSELEMLLSFKSYAKPPAKEEVL